VGQIEVYEWLKKQRLCKNDDYFSIDDIRRGLKAANTGHYSMRYNNVRVACIQLETHGYLEVKMTGKRRAWFRLFRLKQKYLSND
jgi:hypothetical protein